MLNETFQLKKKKRKRKKVCEPIKVNRVLDVSNLYHFRYLINVVVTAAAKCAGSKMTHAI